MKLRLYLLLGALAFFGALVLKAPVATLYGWLKPKDAAPQVEVYGLSGQLLEGRLSGVTSGGRLALADLHWRMKPLWLLLARAAFHVDGGGELAAIDGHVALLPGGSLRLSDFRANGAVKPLMSAAGFPFVPVDGLAGLTVESLNLSEGLPTEAEAHAEVRGLAWTLAREPLPLGDFQADVRTEDDTIIAQIGTLSGGLDLSGEARLLADRSYELQLQLKPKPEAPPMLQNLVRSLGQPDTQGYYHIRRQGSLAPAAAPASPAS